MREFETGATRDDDKHKMVPTGFISPLALLRFSKYMDAHRRQKDGKLREPDNWKAGMPQRVYWESLGRHFMELWIAMDELTVTGYAPEVEHDDITYYPGEPVATTDDILCAILFNVQGLLHERMIGRDVGAVDPVS